MAHCVKVKVGVRKSRSFNKGEKKDESCIFFYIDTISTFKGPFCQAEAASKFETNLLV
jgi:hypothetical protein